MTRTLTDDVEEKKYGINWGKINQIKRENNIIKRWHLHITPDDLINFRTDDYDRVYKSKFEFWDERRKDLVDVFKSTSELLYPPVIKNILHSTLMTLSLPFSLIILGDMYVQILPRNGQRFVKKDNGYTHF